MATAATIVAPGLAVKVLNESNITDEMAHKRREYFAAGVRLVWQVAPLARTVEVYTAPEQATVLHEEDMLGGGAVLPGLTLPLREFFADLDQQPLQ